MEPRAPARNTADAWGSHRLWVQRRIQVRRAWAARILGYLLLAGGLAWLAIVEAPALAAATLVMAAGAALAVASAAWIGRKEAANGGRKAFRLLVAGYALKLAAIPLIALGGGWLAWQIGPGFDVALGVVGLGLCAYAYGVVARLDGLCLLPQGNGGRA